MVDYKKEWKANFYTETNEIEIVSDNITAEIYFENIGQLADLIKTSPRLAKALKELI